MNTENTFQETNLLKGAQSAYTYLQSQFAEFSFRVAIKSDGACGKGWYATPDALKTLSAIVTVENSEGIKVYQITSSNASWTEFNPPVLQGKGPWVGAGYYNPLKITFQEKESYNNLKQYLSAKAFKEVQYTQVSLINQSYPPFQLVYGYDVDLSKYDFNVTQFVAVPQKEEITQADEIGHCPLPS